MTMQKRYISDWLGSSPIFYNTKTNQISYNINDVIDFKNMEFHPEGFNNYLDFGYSVLEQTPVKHVKFLRHSSVLEVDSSGKIQVFYFNDPVEKLLHKTSNETEVIDRIEAKVREWESRMRGEIVVPTSGGFDSRLLNLMVKDKSRIRAFTYGISDNQADSCEVVYAKIIANVLGIQWEQIKLGSFHKYFAEWDNLYGVSTHAHGMYHIEFYSKILEKVAGKNPLLSGIIGDAWAGSVKVEKIDSIDKLKLLGYTHGMNADSKQSLLKSGNEILERYFEENKYKLSDSKWTVVESMRFKIILLSYLIKVPRHFGFTPWSPFLDIDVATDMLTIPAERRENRMWQREFFNKHGLDLENMKIRCSKKNTLNYQGMRYFKLKPLDVSILREVVRPSYVDWINSSIFSRATGPSIISRLLYVPKIGSVLRRLKLKDKKLAAYCAYLTLKPIERLILKRNMAL